MNWIKKIAYQGIEKLLDNEIMELPGEWQKVQSQNNGIGVNASGKPVKEINIKYIVSHVQPGDKNYEIAVWMQIKPKQMKRQFNVQYGHKDVAFEVMVTKPHPDIEHAIIPLANTSTERHTPQEVAQYIQSVINDDSNDEYDQFNITA